MERISEGERLADALLDRFTHRVHIVEANGERYRLEAAKRREKRIKLRWLIFWLPPTLGKGTYACGWIYTCLTHYDLNTILYSPGAALLLRRLEP